MIQFLPAIVAFAITLASTPIYAQPAKTTAEKLDEYLTSAHRAYGFNGTALVAHKGKILLHKAYGVRNAVTKAPNDTSTRFPILSITKSFTSTLILKLQEQGKLSVKDKLSNYFPDFPNGDKIELHHLLTHTSGIFNYTQMIDEEDSAIVCHPVPKQRVLDLFWNKPLEFAPGKQFAYDNSGYFMLGLVIEKVTGKPYEQVVRELIFTPLGMTKSGFDFINLPAQSRAFGYDTLTADYYSPYPHPDSTVIYSAGGIYSTTGDMYNWGKAVASKQLLSVDSWKQAFAPRLNNYGYGWMLGSYFGKQYVGHDGGYPGFMSTFVYYPDDDITIILFKNSGNYHESLAPAVMALTAILVQKPYDLWVPRTATKVSEAILQQYVGRYKVDAKVVPNHIVSISLEDGRLFVQANNSGPKAELFAESENSFFLKAYNEQWTFRMDKKGQVRQAVIRVNGMDVKADKL